MQQQVFLMKIILLGPLCPLVNYLLFFPKKKEEEEVDL